MAKLRFRDPGTGQWVNVDGTGPAGPTGPTGPTGPPSSHAALTDLTADDHAQYFNTTRGDARYVLKTSLVVSTTGPTGTAPTGTLWVRY